MSAIVFAELVVYIEETRLDEETAPIFKLVDLVQLFQSRMEQLEVSANTRVHSTRLKHRLLAQFPDMQAHNKGRDVLMVLEEDVGAALATAWVLDCDSDAVHLASAVQIVRRQMFREAKPFNGFPERCQEESVPSLLLGLVSRILEGPSIKDQVTDTTPAALAVAQILKFSVIEELGNPSEEEGMDLVVLDAKEMADLSAIESVWNVKRIGQEQFHAFTKECLVERTKLFMVSFVNKVKVFNTSSPRSVSKEKQQVASLKNYLQLFLRLYISCQTRDGNQEIRNVLLHFLVEEAFA